MSENTQQRADGRWLPAEPLPEPFGVLWGRLWQQRKRDGDRFALIRSWLDARAISRAAAARRFMPDPGVIPSGPHPK